MVSWHPGKAEGVVEALSNGLRYLVNHFNYIDQMVLLNLAKIRTL